jgi:hypothetical protein
MACMSTLRCILDEISFLILASIGMTAGPEMPVVEGELIRNVALESSRAIDGSSGRKEQVMVFCKINDCADIETDSLVREVNLSNSLMMQFDGCFLKSKPPLQIARRYIR